jgi:hypothetical protein
VACLYPFTLEMRSCLARTVMRGAVVRDYARDRPRLPALHWASWSSGHAQRNNLGAAVERGGNLGGDAIGRHRVRAANGRPCVARVRTFN